MISYIMLNWSGESGHPCIDLNFREIAFSLSLLAIVFIKLENFPSTPIAVCREF